MSEPLTSDNGLLRQVFRVAKTSGFRAGAPIYRQGQAIGIVYVVASGYVRLSAVSREGDEYTQAVLGPGALFGASLSGEAAGVSEASAAALGPVRVYSIPLPHLPDLASRQPALAWCLTQHLAATNAVLERRLQILCHRSVEARLAALLHDLLLQYGARCRHGHDVDMRLTHQDLADMIGASRPVVSAMLADLRRRGLIAYTRRYICVDDAEALRRLSEE